MTEAGWTACSGHDWDEAVREAMVVEQLASKRKVRLYSCACCRLIWPLLKDARSRTAVEAAEGFSDRVIAKRELDLSRNDARKVVRNSGDTPGEFAAYSTTAAKCGPAWVTKLVQDAAVGQGREWHPHAIAAAQRKLLRCIFGNPFSVLTFQDRCRTNSVAALANAVYEERAFDRLPILADALEEAGCNDHDLLRHCREPGEHARGCWAVDLVLGKR